MVSAQDAAEVLAIFRTKVVAAKPQLLKVFIELHGRHCTERWVKVRTQKIVDQTVHRD